jgi:hypothetical protein
MTELIGRVSQPTVSAYVTSASMDPSGIAIAM